MEVVSKKIIMTTSNDNSEYQINNEEDEDDQDVALPGFRFHPTDEELVGFYLKRKVNKKPISIEIIKQIDIYKYDPWDLPSNAGDKEWYYFCIRGRKYRNSIRPNRVTGSGFWKATGIDKPIYSVSRDDDCIGLKKSLVYYRGSAGKGTKTDWMMHEFRLPLTNPSSTQDNNANTNNNALEAEVWTLCRIFKRMTSHKKYNNTILADRCNNGQTSLEITTPKKSSSSILSSLSTATHLDDSSSKTCSLETDYTNSTDHLYHVSLELNSHHNHHRRHLDPQEVLFSQRNKLSKAVDDRDRDCETSSESWFNLGQYNNNNNNIINSNVPQLGIPHIQAPVLSGPRYPSFISPSPNPDDQCFLANGSWDELTPVVQSAVDRNPSRLHDIIAKLQ